MNLRNALATLPLLAGMTMLSACIGTTGLEYDSGRDGGPDTGLPDTGPTQIDDTGPPLRVCTTAIGTTCPVGYSCGAGSCANGVGDLQCDCVEGDAGPECENSCFTPVLPPALDAGCTILCAPGTYMDPIACTCNTIDAGAPGCAMSNSEICPAGALCEQGTCGGPAEPEWCSCNERNGLYECQSWCGTADAAPPVCSVSCPSGYALDEQTCGCFQELVPPPVQQCYIANYGYCDVETSCIVGYCPDNITPISCYCATDLSVECTGACPPPVYDAGPTWFDAGAVGSTDASAPPPGNTVDAGVGFWADASLPQAHTSR